VFASRTHALDPKGILNPGKVFDRRSPDRRIRATPLIRTATAQVNQTRVTRSSVETGRLHWSMIASASMATKNNRLPRQLMVS